MSKIFISYRRADSASASGRIYDRLVTRFSEEMVFKDVDSIPYGANFRTFITDVLRQCAVQLVIIGPRWLDVTEDDGSPRLSNQNDVVRLEIEAALDRGMAIIPVLVDGAKVPPASRLPESLKSLADLNAIAVRHDPDFQTDMRRLITAIDRLVAPAPVVAPASVAPASVAPASVAPASVAPSPVAPAPATPSTTGSGSPYSGSRAGLSSPASPVSASTWRTTTSVATPAAPSRTAWTRTLRSRQEFYLLYLLGVGVAFGIFGVLSDHEIFGEALWLAALGAVGVLLGRTAPFKVARGYDVAAGVFLLLLGIIGFVATTSQAEIVGRVEEILAGWGLNLSPFVSVVHAALGFTLVSVVQRGRVFWYRRFHYLWWFVVPGALLGISGLLYGSSLFAEAIWLVVAGLLGLFAVRIRIGNARLASAYGRVLGVIFMMAGILGVLGGLVQSPLIFDLSHGPLLSLALFPSIVHLLLGFTAFRHG